MATAFQKSQRTSTVGSDRARQYFPSGFAAQTVAANTTVTLTLTAAFQFKGNGELATQIPVGFAMTGALSFGNVVLSQSASGPYSGGNHPVLLVQVTNPTANPITAAACDLLIVQY